MVQSVHVQWLFRSMTAGKDPPRSTNICESVRANRTTVPHRLEEDAEEGRNLLGSLTDVDDRLPRV